MRSWTTCNNAAAFVVAIVSAVGLAGAGCKPRVTPRAQIAVSIFPIYDLARRVAGPDADVTLLAKPNESEHVHTVTPRDVDTIAASRLEIEVGLTLDSWMDRVVAEDAPKARVLKVGDRVPSLTLGEEAGQAPTPGAAIDPHVWLDPQRARLIVRAIVEELARVDSAHANAFRDRAGEIDRALDALDREVEAETKTWSVREFVTLHGAFGYFADRYHLRVATVIEPIAGSPPPTDYLELVTNLVREKKLRAIFGEPELDDAPAKVVAKDANVPLEMLDPIGGNADTDSYEKLIRFNVAALGKAMK